MLRDVEVFESAGVAPRASAAAGARGAATRSSRAGELGDRAVVDTQVMRPSDALRKFADADGLSSAVLVHVSGGEPSTESRPGVAGGSAGDTGVAAFEGPAAKLARLRREVAALADGLAGLVPEGAGGDGSGSEATDSSGQLYRSMLVDLADGAARLQQQLVSLSAQAELVPHLAPTSKVRTAHEASIDLSSQLDREVKAFVQSAGAGTDSSGDGAGAGAGSAAPSAITFELYGGVRGGRGSTGAAADASGVLPRLEARLTELERRVGAGSQAAERLRGGTVMAALEELDNHLALVTPSRMAALLEQAKALTAEFDALYTMHKKATPKSAATAMNVHRLLRLVQPWEAFVHDLPSLVQRLRSLHAVHAQAALMTQRIAAVESTQAAITAQLAADRDVLSQMSASLGDNLAGIAANVANIDGRVEALTKAFEASLGSSGGPAS